MPAGRPTDYKDEYAEEAKKLCEYGLTDAQMAEFFGVSIPTFNAWKGKHPEFLKSLKAGKEIADDLVVRSLYQRAVGYDYHEDKIFNNQGEELIVPTIKHQPADVSAIKLWLVNRRGDEWKDKQDVNHSGSIDISKLSEEELDALIAEMMAAINGGKG